jgi:hypothetical protein
MAISTLNINMRRATQTSKTGYLARYLARIFGS